jgi:hypothetical protein
MASGGSVSRKAKLITQSVILILFLSVVALAALFVTERRHDRALDLRAKMETDLGNLVVEKPAVLPDPVSRDTKQLAALVGKNAPRLWGPLIKPPPPPPPPPPAKPDLGKMAAGLAVKGVLGDPKGGGTVKFLVTGDGKQKIIGAGDKLREFTVKGHSSKGLILEFKGDTINLPVPGF